MKVAATAMIPVMAFVAVILVLLCHPPVTSAQDGIIQVSRHTLPMELQSVNGSSMDGNCQAPLVGLCSGLSDLTDGMTPPVGCFEGDWASGFFTLQRAVDDAVEIGFDFGQSVSVARIELVLLNSPLLRIGVSEVGVFSSSVQFSSFDSGAVAAVGNGTVQESEDALLTVNINTEPPQLQQFYFIQFTFNADSDWVFIGEVTFFNNANPASTVSPVSTSTIMCSTILSPSTTTPANMFATSSSSMQLTPAIPSIETTTTTTTTTTTMATTTSTPAPPEGASEDNVATTIGIAVAFSIFAIIVLIILTILVILVVTKIRRKKHSEIEKFQSAMLEHKSVELKGLEPKQKVDDNIANPHYDEIMKEQPQNPVYSDIPKYTRAKENVDNSHYATIPSKPQSTRNGISEPAPQSQPLTSEYSEIPESTPAVYDVVQKGSGTKVVQPTINEYSEIDDPFHPSYSTIPEAPTSHTPIAVPTPTEYPTVSGTPSEKLADSESQGGGEEDTGPHIYAAVQKEPPPEVPGKSTELVEYLVTKSKQVSAPNEYSGIGPSQNRSTTLPAQRQITTSEKLPPLATVSKPMCEIMHTNPTYHSIDAQGESLMSPTSPVYAVPANPESSVPTSTYDAVYSEPIKPSLFTDDAGSTDYSNSEELPYSSIYTVPILQPKDEETLLEVTGNNIHEIQQLGMGQFGQVVLAETVELSLKDLAMSDTDSNKSESVLVAVKKLRPNAPQGQKETFEKEYKFMARLRDPNVIRLLGICTTDTPFIMMEYMEKGDLNQYLQKFVSVVSETELLPMGEDQIPRSTLLYMSTQIASAMKYLASHNFVHRDLATRNCLVGQNYLVKIADFGMSRNLYETHYYRIHGKAILPIRWMATECFYGKFSQKTDVWAFGVTMWEIYSLAKQQPYYEMNAQEVIDDATKGENRHLLEKPKECPPKVYEIMLKCWAHDPNSRSTFEELHSLLLSV